MSQRKAGWIGWIVVLPIIAWFLLLGLQGADSAWAAHALAILVLTGVLALFVPWVWPEAAGHRVRLALASLAASAAAVVGLGALSASTVAKRAADTAAGRPYCIQVADGRAGYRRARAWPELSVFTMRAVGGDMQFQHHAVLAVGRGAEQRLYNWSYWDTEFGPEVLNHHPEEGRQHGVFCQPRARFAAGLAPLGARPGREVYMRLYGRELRVPRAYRPTAEGDWSTLTIVADAPAFEPGDANAPTGVNVFERQVNFHFDLERAPERVETELDGALDRSLGLMRGPTRQGEAQRFYALGADGRPQALITCHAQGLCQHGFVHDGVLYRFQHPAEALPRWRAMHGRLSRLLADFEAAGRETRPRD